MSLTIKTTTAKVGFGREKSEKEVIRAMRGATVDSEQLIQQVALRTGLTQGVCRAVIDSLWEAAGTYVLEGHGVRLGDFGILKPALVTRAATDEKKAKVIRKKLLFLPSQHAKAMVEKMKLLHVSDMEDVEQDSEQDAEQHPEPDHSNTGSNPGSTGGGSDNPPLSI